MIEATDAAGQRLEILTGLLVGMANGREIFGIVQDAANAPAALAALRQRKFPVPDDVQAVLGSAAQELCLTETQAQAVLNHRLNRFTRADRQELLAELRQHVDAAACERQ